MKVFGRRYIVATMIVGKGTMATQRANLVNLTNRLRFGGFDACSLNYSFTEVI